MSESRELTISQNTALAIGNFDDLLKRSEFLAQSELVPVALRGKPANVAVILQMGLELGIPPMQAINGIDCIQGKPAISPQLGLALVRSKLPNFYIKVETAPDSVRVTVGRDRERPEEFYTAVFGDSQAKAMQLDRKDNYIKQKHTMYRWRATMEALRFIASDILKGFYSDDEAENIPPEGSGNDNQEKAARLAALKKKPEPKDVDVVVMENGSEIHLAKEAPAETISAQGPKPGPTLTVAPPKAEEPAPSWDASLSNDGEAFDPLASYTLKGGHSLKGKKLRDIDRDVLSDFLINTRDHFKRNNKVLTGVNLEDVSRLDDYLRASQPELVLEPGSAG